MTIKPNGKVRKEIPQWLQDWLAKRPPLESISTDFGVITVEADPAQLIRRIKEWKHAHPEIAAIPSITQGLEELQQAASKRLRQRKRSPKKHMAK